MQNVTTYPISKLFPGESSAVPPISPRVTRSTAMWTYEKPTDGEQTPRNRSRVKTDKD